MRTTSIGHRAERLAAKHLLSRGLKLTAENDSCKFGEIDLIMEEGTSKLIFVEVRYRSKDNYGSPFETITELKQTRIRRTAAHFLLSHSEYQTFACRFDVIGLIANPLGHQFQWIQAAFYYRPHSMALILSSIFYNRPPIVADNTCENTAR